jgi:hypothetical protein
MVPHLFCRYSLHSRGSHCELQAFTGVCGPLIGFVGISSSLAKIDKITAEGKRLRPNLKKYFGVFLERFFENHEILLSG